MRKPLFFLMLFASATLAAEAPTAHPDVKLKREWEERFRAADADQNRSLNRQEAEAGLPKVLWRNFDRIDTNGDGGITPEELWAMHEREVVEREKRRAARVGPPR
jgi:hypothetical protein